MYKKIAKGLVLIGLFSQSYNNAIASGETGSNRYLYPKIVQIDDEEIQEDSVTDEEGSSTNNAGEYIAGVSMEPDVRLIKEIDTLKLSPLYRINISLPPEMTITDAASSFTPKQEKLTKNNLTIQPKDDFVKGNISLYIADKNHRYYMTIIVERFFESIEEMENLLNKVKTESTKKEIKKRITEAKQGKKEILNLVIRYVLPTILSPENALKTYLKMTNKNEIDIDNGDYVSFLYDGIVYKITRDDENGALRYHKKAFIVENSLQ